MAIAGASIVRCMLPGPSIAVLARFSLIFWFWSNITFVGWMLNPDGEVCSVVTI